LNNQVLHVLINRTMPLMALGDNMGLMSGGAGLADGRGWDDRSLSRDRITENSVVLVGIIVIKVMRWS
jgi:hypothetical protein